MPAHPVPVAPVDPRPHPAARRGAGANSGRGGRARRRRRPGHPTLAASRRMAGGAPGADRAAPERTVADGDLGPHRRQLAAARRTRPLCSETARCWSSGAGRAPAICHGRGVRPGDQPLDSGRGIANTRSGHTATALANGAVLVVGGQSTDTSYTASAERYDPATNSWAPAATMTTARTGHTATVLPGGAVLVAGGTRRAVPPHRGALRPGDEHLGAGGDHDHGPHRPHRHRPARGPGARRRRTGRRGGDDGGALRPGDEHAGRARAP